MVAKRKYSTKDLDNAVHQVMAGGKVLTVSKSTGIPRKTLADNVKLERAGTRQDLRRHGPAPILPEEAETSIFEWVISRQQVGHPVTRAIIVCRASDISMMLFGKPLTDGWYTRFMERHPRLTNRIAQAINKVRNKVDECDIILLFETLSKVMKENGIDANRVFNVDETAFQTRKKTKSVIAASGSSNVWSTEITTSFHMSIVACGSAAGFVVPPTFILPGKTVEYSILDTDKSGAVVTTTESRFMNNWLFMSR